MNILSNGVFLLAITFLAYIGARRLQEVTGQRLLNPILVATTAIILFLTGAGIDYDMYHEEAGFIEFWLKPAIVALGVPLYRQLETIRRQLLPILLSEFAGCVAGILSVVVVAKFLGATDEVVVSLAPKSVTTPIAMEVSSALGGLPALTAAVVVCTGIFGAMTGFQMMRISRVKSPIAQGLSMGTAAHAIGTSAAIDLAGQRYGAFSSLGLTINGLFTALLTPLLLAALGVNV